MKLFLTLVFLLTLSACTTADVNDASRTAASGACSQSVSEGARAVGATGGIMERIAASAVSRVISSTACR